MCGQLGREVEQMVVHEQMTAVVQRVVGSSSHFEQLDS